MRATLKRSKFMPKIGSLALAACLAFSSSPIFAEEPKNIEVSFTDVTNSANTLKGEAKVKVSVKGADGKATIAQMSLDFDGDLQYKSTQFLKGSNDPDKGNYWTARANKNNNLMATVISTGGIDFSDDEELFVITFKGDPGKTVTLNLEDFENTYCTVDGVDRNPNTEKTITLTASDKENVGKSAVIRLVMDKVLDFTGTGDSGITIKITNENQKGDEITTQVDNSSQSNGGHRDGTTSTPTFVVDNTVIADNTYTVEVSGIGYITYKKKGVKFNEELKLTNSDFIPGDVNNDGKVDIQDKTMAQQFIDDKEYSISADFNRDGKVNKDDMDVFDGIKDDTQSGADNGNNNNNNNNNNSGNTNSGSTGSGGNGGGGNGGGGGGNGGGNSSGNSGSGSHSGSGGGGGSFGGGGGFGGGTSSTTQPTETFTDLGDFDWAKDSIYTLKNKKIISGISDTEFAPAANIKRGDFILILTRMLGINDEFTENFADVPADSYYYNAIGSAKAAGVANGDGGNFMPENSITRQDLITLAYRAFLNKGYITETDDMTVLDSFGDKASIADYASSAMASMVKAGIIKGSDGNVNPTGNATRAEVAVMCARMLDLMK